MRFFNKLSIRIQVLVIGAVIIAIIPFVIVRVYQQSREVVINQNTQYNMELVSLLKTRVSSNNANVSNLMINLGYSTTVQDFLLEDDNFKVYDLSKKVESLIGVIMSTNTDILEIIAVNRSGRHISMSGKINYALDTMDTVEENGTVQYLGFRGADRYFNQDKFLFGMNIYAYNDMSRYGEKIGFVTVVLDAKSINTELEKFPRLTGTSFYMLDKNDIVYTNSNQQELLLDYDRLTRFDEYSGKAVIERIGNQPFAIQSFTLPEIEGKIITLVPINNLMKELASLKKTSYILLAITLILVSIPYTFLMMNLLKPLTKLMAFMKRLKGGSLEVLHSKVDLVGYAEIEVISNQFNAMLERIHDLTDQLVQATAQLYQADIEKQRAEFSFLQSQINPHFLSNTLDSIKGIAIVKGNRDIYDMAGALSSMLRYSIKGTDEVSLEEELKIVNAYVKIHQGRFPGRIEYEQNCPDEFKMIRIPKMIIQPIVENALCHGLEPHADGGTVHVSAMKRRDGQLEVIVRDNGVGIEADRLDELRAMLNANDPLSNQHIGMNNVKNRIRLKYGDPYGLSITSEKGQGTVVMLTIPVSL